jgi:uncharacterized repeat protein (TIGR01451 family)
LPPTASGQAIQLRWRCGSDSGVSATGWYVDSVSVTSSNYVCCTQSADLSVSLVASPNPVLVGQTVSYTLTVTNVGPSPASSVTLTDALPATVTFVSASPACVNLGGNVVCNLGTLSSGGATNFTIVVTPTAGGLITNILTVASPTPDPNSANNSATSVTTVNSPPTISRIGLTGSVVSITFPSVNGLSYGLEYKNSLNDPSWTLVSPMVAGTGGVTVLQDTNAPAVSRYYRLRRQ